MNRKQLSYFDDQRLTLEDSLDLTRQSLLAYGLDYPHWAIAYSGDQGRSGAITGKLHPKLRPRHPQF
jgi:DNA sulfur modification protein DndC